MRAYRHLPALVIPLRLRLQKSLSLGKLPSDWKLVTALYKKGPKSNRANYRPVSLTSVCCKLLESFIRDDIMKYLTDNKLISSRQYGFFKGRSTSLQLLHICTGATMPGRSGRHSLGDGRQAAPYRPTQSQTRPLARLVAAA